LCMTPRRFGKTISVAIFVVAMMIACPGIVIGTFSTGRRASGGIMDLVSQMISNIPGLKERVVRQNEEQLFLAATKAATGYSSVAKSQQEKAFTTSKFFAYPSSVNSSVVYLFLWVGWLQHHCFLFLSLSCISIGSALGSLQILTVRIISISDN